MPVQHGSELSESEVDEVSKPAGVFGGGNGARGKDRTVQNRVSHLQVRIVPPGPFARPLALPPEAFIDIPVEYRAFG